jgi:hypothetical protein
LQTPFPALFPLAWWGYDLRWLMTIYTEIPETEFALNQYVLFCENQIKESRSLIKRLQNRIKKCEEKAANRGFVLNKDRNKL